MHVDDNFSGGKESQRFVLVGGFLGAGKTTLIRLLTRKLQELGKQVALITNDQGQGLMDTVSAQQAGGKVAEITGGCFCCRLEELVGAIRYLEEEARPDVMIAEPVGSCTDLMATVIQPLEKIYHTPMTLAPLSVAIDSRRALAVLGGKKNKRSFHRDVGYVYRKQLEEAEWLVVNKVDLLEEDDISDLTTRLEREFPGKRVFFVSAKTGEGVEEWNEALLTHESNPEELMEVDYERYAEGEAMLGWVNLEGTVAISKDRAGEWLRDLAVRISGMMDAGGHEVGHFKMSLEGGGKRWRVHQVMGGDEVELLEESGKEGELQLLVNLRAEGEAEVLQSMVHLALRAQDEAEVFFQQEAAFQPGKPEPTHRVMSQVSL